MKYGLVSNPRSTARFMFSDGSSTADLVISRRNQSHRAEQPVSHLDVHRLEEAEEPHVFLVVSMCLTRDAAIRPQTPPR